MAKTRKTEKPEIELEPDAWSRFEKFVKHVAKAGPQHRQAPKNAPPKRPKPKTKQPRRISAKR